MKKLTMTLIAGAVLGASALVSAPASAKMADGVNPWQHCGIGSYVFPDNGVAAAISNVIWDLGTTAVTSATVTPETCNSNLVTTALLIDSSYDQLVMQTAQGSGEHLNAALNLAGCSATAETVGALRNDLNAVVSSAGYADMTHEDKAYSFYSSLEKVSANCGA
ncbi:DUF3015 family protein [Aliidiomarina taiwanensis]|nr:DUF3015 family protein [Aliidiomarina taiwanensis]